MASGSKSRGRKGKLGRHKAAIAAYYNGCQWHWNKARRIIAHIKRYGHGDTLANEALNTLKAAMPLHMERRLSSPP